MLRGDRRQATTANAGKSPAAKRRKLNTKNTGNATGGQKDPRVQLFPQCCREGACAGDKPRKQGRTQRRSDNVERKAARQLA